MKTVPTQLCAAVLLALATTALPGGPALAAPVAGSAAATPAGALAPRAVLDVMQRVADWQLAHPSAHPATDWTQGTGYAGMMALAGISGDGKYRAAMVAMGERNGWKLGPDRYHADDQIVGQTYAELYLQLRDPKMIAPMRAQFDAMLADPRDGSMEFNLKEALQRWVWCDALFMAPPAWARLSAATGDPRYLELAISHWWRTSDYLYDKEEHLYARDSTYFHKREANGRKMFWSRGNGWVLGGLARMLQYIPEGHRARGRFEQQFREMAARMLALQPADGLWRSSLLDPASYPLQETSGTALTTYALAWGINQGLLDRAAYEPAVRKGWSALNASVQRDGKLIHVQPIGQDPKSFDPESTEVYGVGAFLLAGSEMYRMALLAQATPRVVTVSNPDATFRADETVEARLPGHQLAVLDATTSRFLTSQMTAQGVLFQANLAPRESRRYLVFERAALAALPPADVRAHARFVPERLDDFAWESDRIAHRVYGPAIMTDPKEMLVSSGVDAWAKSAHKLVLDRWYKAGDYHLDKGEGLDFYHVGRSRGCGGLGIYDGNTLFTSSNYSQWKVLADGPLRAEFELRFPSWQAGAQQVAEVRRVSIDAGSNFSRVESSFSATAPLAIGVGIARRDGDGRVVADADARWLSYWEPRHGADGSMACSVILPGGLRSTEIAGHYLAVGQAQPGQPFVYYLGAGWSKSGDFANPAQWEAYVQDTAARIAAPATVQVQAPL